MSEFIQLCRMLSKTDDVLLEQGGSNSAHSTQTSLGFFVLLIGIVSGFTAWYWFDFFVENVIVHVMAVLLTMTVMLATYRELIGGYSRFALIAGIPIALVVAFISQIPFKLAIFSDSIIPQITYLELQKNAKIIKHRDSRLNDSEKKFDKDVRILGEKRSKLLGKISKSRTKMESTYIASSLGSIDNQLAQIERRRLESSESINDDFSKKYTKLQDGFWTRYESFQMLVEKNRHIKRVSLVLDSAAVLLFLLPIIIKLFNFTEYHSHLGNQKDMRIREGGSIVRSHGEFIEMNKPVSGYLISDSSQSMMRSLPSR